jgi:ribonuclease P protein subunit POP4
MKVTPAVLQQCFIGLNAKVTRSSNPEYVSVKGEVVDETRNTLVILHEEKEKKIIKDVAVFHFTLPDGTVVEIDGKSIVGRSENRVKKKVKRRW